MWLVCGLGNPGNKFQNTRHNVGFDIFDLIIKKYNFELKKKDTTKELFKGTIAGFKLPLLQTPDLHEPFWHCY